MLIKKFFQKYWLGFLWFSLLCVIILYYIPRQEGHYLREANSHIKEDAHIVVFAISGLLSVLYIFLFVRNFTNWIDLLYLVVGIIGITLTLFLSFTPFVQSGIYIMNGGITKETVTKKYMIEKMGSTREFIFYYDPQENKHLALEECLSFDAENWYRTGDTAVFVFKKGLFGYIHSPVLKRK